MSTVVLSTGNATDVGRERAENQDYFGAYEGSPCGDLWVICDGVGGAAGGRTASTMAVETIRSTFQSGQHADGPSAILASVAEANSAVYGRAVQDRLLHGMATTVVILVINQGRAVVAHAGDSRAYLIREGHMVQLTKDHTLVQSLVDAGQIAPEQAASHPENHIITRSLGIEEHIEVEVDTEDFEVKVGDRFVLCSDGLSGQVSDEIIQEVAGELDPQKACRMLIKLANEAGGPDNITVQIVSVGAETSRLDTIRRAVQSRLTSGRRWVWLAVVVAVAALGVGGGVWLAGGTGNDKSDVGTETGSGTRITEGPAENPVTQSDAQNLIKPGPTGEDGARTKEGEAQP